MIHRVAAAFGPLSPSYGKRGKAINSAARAAAINAAFTLFHHDAAQG